MLPDTALGCPGWRCSSIQPSPSPRRARQCLQPKRCRKNFWPLKAAFPPGAWTVAQEGKTPVSAPATQQQRTGTIMQWKCLSISRALSFSVFPVTSAASKPLSRLPLASESREWGGKICDLTDIFPDAFGEILEVAGSPSKHFYNTALPTIMWATCRPATQILWPSLRKDGLDSSSS